MEKYSPPSKAVSNPTSDILHFFIFSGSIGKIDLEQTSIVNPLLTRNCSRSRLTTNGITNGDVIISVYDALYNSLSV